MMRKFLAPLAALAFAGAPLAAQPQATQPAALADLVAKVNIPYQAFTLPNGLRVIVHEDRKAPVVAVSVWYHVGSKDEPKGKTGFAHLFEHLMFNGSENAPGDYFEPLQQVGATDFNGTTWFDRTNYFQTVPTPALERVLFLESDRMGHLLGAVTQEKLDNQRGVVQNEKRQGDNQPYGMVEYAQLEALFPQGHPYHHSTIGSMADLDAASLETVKDWFRTKYGPNNAVIVLAGDIDAKTARPLMQKWFGDIPRGPKVVPASADVPTLAARKEMLLKDRVATTRIYRMWAVPGMLDKDAVPLDIAASVLGGLSSSRLDNALVRQEKLAVGVSTSLQPFERVSLFEVYADVRPGVDATVVAKRLDALIAEFIANGPTSDEVKRVATKEVAGVISGLESVGGFGGKATTLAEGALYANDPGHYKKELNEYAAATPAVVRAAAAKWLTRPVFALTVEPGERDPYEEAGGSAPVKATQAPSYYRTPQAGEAPLAPPSKLAPLARADGEGRSAGGTSAPLAAVDRSKLPEMGTIPDLKFPTVTRAKLSNGIEIVYAQRDAVPVTRLSVVFDAGNAADPKDKLGLQSLMLALLDEGTTSRNSIQIAEEQERLGAQIAAGASMDRTTLSLFSLTPNLAPSLDLLADIIRNPAFDPAEVERLRAQQLARIASEQTQPQAMALRTLPPLLYGTAHPYGIPFTGTGDPAVVAKVTRADMIAFHRAWLRPDNATIFVVSDQPLSVVQPAMEQVFGQWTATGAKGVKNFEAVPPAPRPRIVLVDRPGSPQSMIIGGELLPLKGQEEIVTLLSANDVLGGNFLSRMNMNLRETKGWAYGVKSLVNRVVETMPWLVYAPVQADKTGASIQALIGDMGEFLGPKGVTKEELERTINGSIRELPGSFETAADVLGAMQRNVLYNRPDDYYDTLADRYRAMTAADLDKSIRGIVDPAKLTWVVVGDAAKIRAQLDAVGLPVETLPSAAPGK